MSKVTDIGQKWLELLVPFSFNYNKKFVASDLEKKTGIPSRTVSRYLKNLVKLGFIRVETEGRNNRYYIDLNKNISKILIMIIENYKSLKYRADLETWPLIDELMSLGEFVLFGSYAKKCATKESDIDILFFGKKTKAAEEVAGNHPRNVDIKFATINEFKSLLKKENTLSIEIIKSHVTFNCPEFLDICWRYYKNEL